MQNIKSKLLSIMLILTLAVGLVGIVNVDPSYAASKKIHVKKKPVTLQVGQKYQQKLIAKNGKTIKAKKVKWKSKKPSVAKINKKGKITAVRPGTAKMTAKYKGKTYKFTVNVKAAPAPVPVPAPVPAPQFPVIEKVINQNIVSNSDGSYVTFSTIDDKGNYVATSGTATISIVDSEHNTIYNKTISFDANDFYDSSSYGLCCSLHIPYREIATSSSLSGRIYMDFTFKGGSTWTDYDFVDNLPVDQETGNKALHDYIIKNGKEVTGTSGYIGDYYVKDIGFSDTVVASTYLDSNTIIMYHYDSNKTELCLFHNQPDVPQGIDSFNYKTKDKVNNYFTLNYWGNIDLKEYCFQAQGRGVSGVEKTGPSEVTDTTELYKVHRRLDDAMYRFNWFLETTVGTQLSCLGYEKY